MYFRVYFNIQTDFFFPPQNMLLQIKLARADWSVLGWSSWSRISQLAIADRRLTPPSLHTKYTAGHFGHWVQTWRRAFKVIVYKTPICSHTGWTWWSKNQLDRNIKFATANYMYMYNEVENLYILDHCNFFFFFFFFFFCAEGEWKQFIPLHFFLCRRWMKTNL